jgi:hypothetical protein
MASAENDYDRCLASWSDSRKAKVCRGAINANGGSELRSYAKD